VTVALNYLELRLKMTHQDMVVIGKILMKNLPELRKDARLTVKIAYEIMEELEKGAKVYGN